MVFGISTEKQILKRKKRSIFILMQFMLQKYYFFFELCKKNVEKMRARGGSGKLLLLAFCFQPNTFLYTLPTPAIAFVHPAHRGHEGLSTSRDLSLDALWVYLPKDEL